MLKLRSLLFLTGFYSLLSFHGYSQKIATKKYPSLFWEITGKGMKKPSYLFGTMHVSSKLVFHLSDSFYYALRNVDAVALELNPEIWQGQMVRMDKLQQNYRDFSQALRNEFLNEKSFQIDNYEDELKAALSSEPTVINSLLYRSYKAREDFEEDTFLDLYIFQTAKKLGKRATGVENYFETERLILEAYNDMAKEKKKRSVDTDGQSMYEIEQKTQDAYRRGDLDLLDSLDRMVERSDAFREKFMYKRNEIQANSIDTIMQKSSLFVGVGAAHLAGDRGVIELLRKKGYKLRPVYMIDRDASQKEAIDKLRVPVNFNVVTSSDNFINVQTPGPLYKMTGDYSALDRLQYSDMSNGSYYLLSRVKTHSSFFGQSTEKVLKKVDSLLYENIPGKIVKKISIETNGFKGFDIINRTRRGDLQRYQIIVTPFEVLIFKLGGKENYIEGEEANKFFGSINLKSSDKAWIDFQPTQGGFNIKMPGTPHQKLAPSRDGIERWEYEAIDDKTGDSYLLMKKSIQAFNFIEEDTFNLSLIEESFRLSEIIEKQVSRELKLINGHPALDVVLSLKSGGIIKARYLVSGADHYLLAAKSRSSKADFSSYFNSFAFTPYRYKQMENVTDTFMHYSVKTPVVPELEQNLRSVIEKLYDEGSGIAKFTYWPKSRSAAFRSDSTGETIGVTVQQYPKYFEVKDSTAFWTNEIKDYIRNTDMIIVKRDSFKIKGNILGYQIFFADTNSSRIIRRMFLLNNDRMYRVVTSYDSTRPESDFVRNFYASFLPNSAKGSGGIFSHKLDLFIQDFGSKDSVMKAHAEEAISNIYYGQNGIKKLLSLIDKMQFGKKQYFEIKAKFIAELGYIREPESADLIVRSLKAIFERSGDTSTFQNEVLRSLAKHRSKQSYAVLKELLLQDPPVFENNYEYSGFFNDLEDSLALTRTLFPEILQLSTIDDYKNRINSLLVVLVDSGYLQQKDYESFFSKIYFDARIELKKQLGKDEKTLDRANNDNNDDDRSYYDYNNFNNSSQSALEDYAVLLMPFYESKPVVPKFFEKLLASKDPMVQLRASISMLRSNKKIPDSVLTSLAKSDKTRSWLYKAMAKTNSLSFFPGKYKNQRAIALSNLINDKNNVRFDSVVFISKKSISFYGQKGTVYFFKYRFKKEEDWKIGISGLEGQTVSIITNDDRLSKLTDKRLKNDEPLDQQLNEQLKRLIFSLRKSSKSFYGSDSYSGYRNDD